MEDLSLRKDEIIEVLQECGKKLASKDFYDHGSTEPLIFVQVPFQGTCAIVFLKDVLHPRETTACMDLIWNAFQERGMDICVIADDLTTLEINI